jgi:hypothetical protein
MTTLVLGAPPPELEALLERRRRAGVDRLDEVWQGVRHMVPGPSSEHARISQQLAEILGPPARAAGLLPAMGEFNLGESEYDFRVPDGGLLHPGAAGVWLSTAAVVVEILSPDDESCCTPPRSRSWQRCRSRRSRTPCRPSPRAASCG